MLPSSFKRLALIFILTGLAGCQQHGGQSNTPVTVNEQIEQLASIIAGTQYLREHCNRSDLPEDDVVRKVAYNLAQQRGWETSGYSALISRSENIYQRLTEDSTPEQTKCATFNKQLAPFTAELRHNGG